MASNSQPTVPTATCPAERIFLRACHPRSPNLNCSWSVDYNREGSVEYVRADQVATPASEMFPIQDSADVPMVMAEKAYGTYKDFYGGSQTLKRLGERGGFGRQEFACLYNGHRPTDHPECLESVDAVRLELASLRARIAELEAATTPSKSDEETAREPESLRVA